jgi:hypothetical protein
MGIKDMSTPRLNRAIPIVMIAALIKKKAKLQGGMGAAVKFSASTSKIMGTTDFDDSLSLSNSSFSIRPPLFCQF